MEWTDDVSAGDWLRERIDDPWRGTMHDVVPRSFPAYARVLHRPHVTTLPGGRMLPAEEWVALSEHEQRDRVERMTTETSTWAEVAKAFGTELHPEVQWSRLVRTPTDANGWRQVIAPDGREFTAPAEGQLDPDLLAVVAAHLAAHTTSPDDGFVALWEGWGGLLGFFGDTPSRTFLSFAADSGAPVDPEVARHNEMLARSIHDPFNNVFRKPVWQPGILPDKASRGPRLELPGRGHVLFRGGVVELTGEWMLRMPWRDRIAEEHGFAPAALAPGLVWPTDRAWILVTEVDYDSTIVGGSPDLVQAICTDPRLEAFALRPDADLSWTGDRINR